MSQLQVPVSFDVTSASLVGERLSLEAFSQLSGNLSGYPFVKLVWDRQACEGRGQIHFLNHSQYAFHGHYIADQILSVTRQQLEGDIDAFNYGFYQDPERRFFLGILALHSKKGRRFFSLETVEIDSMSGPLIQEFYGKVQNWIDPSVPVLFKPANHAQEACVSEISSLELPRVLAHELFSSAQYVALQAGKVRGRLRSFKTVEDYRRAGMSLEWYDILVMHRVPDDIPRVSGLINAHPTTPLSHTNVLAAGWGIPNAVQLGVLDRIEREGLEGRWVDFEVDPKAESVSLKKVEGIFEPPARPSWSVQRIQLEEPEVQNVPILPLESLRMGDRYKYGTKAANLGELHRVLGEGSERLLGFYRIKRPPRAHLLSYLAKRLGTAENADLAHAASRFLRERLSVPRGIALPFSLQQEFLESSPRIQQAIGKLKMALELSAREIDPLCVNLQTLIRQTRIAGGLRDRIDSKIAENLSGVSSFVVRSSSNAEDLEGFSAAGIYESINHASTSEKVFDAIKEVWASLLSPRSVRLRAQVGISLDDCYMGVVIQEEVPSQLGGVLVTTNPLNRGGDFRNVYLNASTRSVKSVVQGEGGLPYQYLYNVVEGGGRTISLGDSGADLSEENLAKLQDLAVAGRLLQSHFSPDYTFSSPVDIEWVLGAEGISILQLRPYSR